MVIGHRGIDPLPIRSDKAQVKLSPRVDQSMTCVVHHQCVGSLVCRIQNRVDHVSVSRRILDDHTMFGWQPPDAVITQQLGES
jgi:hypothetical protein